MPNQLKVFWDMFGHKGARVVVEIDENGRAEIKDYQLIHKPDYVG